MYINCFAAFVHVEDEDEEEDEDEDEDEDDDSTSTRLRFIFTAKKVLESISVSLMIAFFIEVVPVALFTEEVVLVAAGSTVETRSKITDRFRFIRGCNDELEESLVASLPKDKEARPLRPDPEELPCITHSC